MDALINELITLDCLDSLYNVILIDLTLGSIADCLNKETKYENEWYGVYIKKSFSEIWSSRLDSILKSLIFSALFIGYIRSDLFNSGIRPAINVGISVSRVGGSAQIKSMKKIAGTLKLDQAAFRELEAFSKFGSDLDAATQLIIDRGQINQEILKQPQYSPLRVEEQVAVIYCSSNGFFDGIELNKISKLEEEFLQHVNSKCKKVLDELADGVLKDASLRILEDAAKNIAKNYK